MSWKGNTEHFLEISNQPEIHALADKSMQKVEQNRQALNVCIDPRKLLQNPGY